MMATCIRHSATFVASIARSKAISSRHTFTKFHQIRLLICPFVRYTGTTPTAVVRQQASNSRNGKRTWWFLTGPSLALLGFGSKEKEEDPKLSSEEDKKRRKYLGMVNHLYFKAAEAMQRKKFVEADKIFHEALDLTANLTKEGKITEKDHLNHIAFLYAEMGNNSLAFGNIRGAEKLFKDGIAVAIQLGMDPTHNAIIEMSLKMADIYGRLKEDDLALAGYRFCIQEQSHKVKENPNIDEDSKALLGMSYQAYGRYLSDRQKYAEAKKAFTRSYEVSKQVHEAGSNQPLTILCDIGNVMILMEDYEGAEILFLDGIKQGEKAKAEMLSALYCNLGALYLRMSKVKEAENACDKALALGKKHKDQLFEAMANSCLMKIQELKLKENLVKD